MSTHHDLEQKLTASLGQLLHSEVVDDQQVRFQVPPHHTVVAVHRFVMQEVADDIEDAAIQDDVSQFDQLISDALDEMALAGPGR